MKVCSDCGLEKPLEDFHTDASRRLGVTNRCRDCDNAKSRSYYVRNRARVIARVQRLAARPVRLCERCERPAISPQHHYCVECQRAALDERVSRRYRGGLNPVQIAKARERERARVRAPRPEHHLRYGETHRRARAQMAVAVGRGGVRCARGSYCELAETIGGARVGGLIVPGTPWDLGHPDGQSAGGPEHRRCNRATAKRDRRVAA